MSLLQEATEHQPDGRSYVALARKWRPRSFAEVVGQQHVVRALQNSIAGGRAHHAYLLTGTRGVGKTTVARILAKTFCCRDASGGEACGKCDACREIDASSHPDVLEMDAASHTKVDNMREILESATYMPSSAAYRVFIIDEVHMLSTSAFNAMLKTLEEPPAHVKFILATTDPQKVPVTVLSRCLQFNLKRIRPEILRRRMEDILGEEGISHDDGALDLVAQLAEGSLRDALSLLDQLVADGSGKVEKASVCEVVGVVEADVVRQALAAAIAGDHAKIHALVAQLYDQGASLDDLLLQLSSRLNRIALQCAAGNPPEIEGAAGRGLDVAGAHVLYEIALNARRNLAYAPDPRAGAEMALLRMAWYLANRNDAAQPPKSEPRRQGRQKAGGDPKPAQGALPTSQNEWETFVKERLTGFAKNTAKTCSFVSSGPGDAISLSCAQAPRTEMIRKGLSEAIGRSVQLTIAQSDRQSAGENSRTRGGDPDAGAPPEVGDPRSGDAPDNAPGNDADKLARKEPDVKFVLDSFQGAEILEHTIEIEKPRRADDRH